MVLHANTAITLSIAMAVFPVFRECSLQIAICFLAVSTVWMVIQSVDNAHILGVERNALLKGHQV
jgi:hypothetical protein